MNFCEIIEFFLEWEMFQTEVVEKIKTHILCSSATFFWKLCHLWDKVERYGRARQATDDNIIWHMSFACWITKSTDTHSEYVILIAFYSNSGFVIVSQCYICMYSAFFLRLWYMYSIFIEDIRTYMLTFSVQPFKCYDSTMARALFALNANC